MDKPQLKTHRYFDYYEVEEYVSKKLGYSLDDVLGKYKGDKINNSVASLNFWHWLTDWVPVHSGSYITMDDLVEYIEPDTEWVRPILEAFVEVVGDNFVWMSW